MRLLTRAVAGLIAASALVLAPALAQTYPSKPVRVVTAFSAGSGPDAMLRMVAEKLSRLWGQPVVVDNKPGASGFIAAAEARRSSADGYTLLHMDGLNLTAIPHMYKKLPYDAETDIEPISPIHGSYFFVAVSADSPWNTVGDLVKAAKAAPGNVTYGSWQVGSVAHLFGAALEVATGTRMMHVPFKDNSQLYTSVARQDVAWAFGSAASAGPLVKSGKLKFLAIAAPERASTHPQVPTVAATGGPAGFAARGWVGLFAAKGVPASVTEKVAADLARVLGEDDLKAKMTELGYDRMPRTPAETRALIASESKEFKTVVTRTGVALD
jgi:tripartite-type tricarboxylate transporter receptor subunit TctC